MCQNRDKYALKHEINMCKIEINMRQNIRDNYVPNTRDKYVPKHEINMCQNRDKYVPNMRDKYVP